MVPQELVGLTEHQELQVVMVLRVPVGNLALQGQVVNLALQGQVVSLELQAQVV